VRKYQILFTLRLSQVNTDYLSVAVSHVSHFLNFIFLLIDDLQYVYLCLSIGDQIAYPRGEGTHFHVIRDQILQLVVEIGARYIAVVVAL
jgi:hypothetical protein